MIKSLNENIEFDQMIDQLFEELENRTEFGCSGNVCGGNATGCAPMNC